jgi:hypothetical protein
MMALKATRARTTGMLFSEIGLLKSGIDWKQERIGELILESLETSFKDLISLKENRKDYNKMYMKFYNRHQMALNNAHCYIKHSNTSYVLDDLVY